MVVDVVFLQSKAKIYIFYYENLYFSLFAVLFLLVWFEICDLLVGLFDYGFFCSL